MLRAITICTAILCGWIVSTSYAFEPSTDFPRTWTGIFRWHEYIGDQYVDISVEKILSKENQISIKGKGTYTIDGEITEINIEWLIDKQTRFIEMWESNPDGADGFVTDGSFKGSISRDFKSIHALWRTRGTDETATINLEASGDES